MKTDLLTDFESAIESVSVVYFGYGFLVGLLVCFSIFIFALFLTR